MDSPTPSFASLSARDARRWLAEGNIVTVTIKLPENLREAARDEAMLRGTTLSSFLREILIAELHRTHGERDTL